jgi:hypothetical protein
VFWSLGFRVWICFGFRISDFEFPGKFISSSQIAHQFRQIAAVSQKGVLDFAEEFKVADFNADVIGGWIRVDSSVRQWEGRSCEDGGNCWPWRPGYWAE